MGDDAVAMHARLRLAHRPPSQPDEAEDVFVLYSFVQSLDTARIVSPSSRYACHYGCRGRTRVAANVTVCARRRLSAVGGCVCTLTAAWQRALCSTWPILPTSPRWNLIA